MRRTVFASALISLIVSLSACGVATSTPATPAAPSIAQIQRDGQAALDMLNAVSVISKTAYDFAKQSLPTEAPAIGDLVRAYNCALISPQDDPAAVAICTAHQTPVLSIAKQLVAATTETSITSLRAQGVALANSLLTEVQKNPTLTPYAAAARALLNGAAPIFVDVTEPAPGSIALRGLR